MKRLSVCLLVIVAAVSLALAGCQQAAPAPAQAPAQPAAPAPAKAAEPTKAPAAPAAAPAAAPTKAPEPAKKVVYPEKGKPIICVVPWGAGGTTDVMTRMLCAQLEKILGTSVEVVNKAGGGSQVGLTDIAKAKPDGYTFGPTNLATTILTYLDPERKAAYDRKGFAPVANIYSDPDVWSVSSKVGIKSIKDFLDAAKADPKKLRYASSANGGDDHMVLLMVQRLINIKFPAVHADSAASRNALILGDNSEWGIGGIGGWMPLVKSNEVVPLAVLSEAENKYLPGVKTAKSQGVDMVSGALRAYSMPGGTPAEYVNALADAMKKASEDPGFRQKLEELGLTYDFQGPEALSKSWDGMESWAKEATKLLAEASK